MLGRASKARAQDRVLRRNADRAGVQVALAHHDAARSDERRGGESELVGAEERTNRDIASGAQTAIHLNRNASAQGVQNQGLMGFGKANFPRRTGMGERGDRRSPGATLKPGNRDMIGARLGHTSGNGSDSYFGN